MLTIGDFNQDGKPDVAAAEGGGLTVLLNDGKANFKAVTSSGEPWNFAPGIAAGDFNGDGLLDLAVSGQSLSNPAEGTVTILLGRGDGTFQASPGLETTGFGALVAMDLNSDGHVDLVEGLSSLVFFAGQGDGTFVNGRSFRGSGNSGALALADFTGTGVMGFAGTNHFETTDGMQIAGNGVILPRAVWPLPALANVSAARLWFRTPGARKHRERVRSKPGGEIRAGHGNTADIARRGDSIGDRLGGRGPAGAALLCLARTGELRNPG